MASTATVRLYAELAEFVPKRRRESEYVVDVAGSRSVKDAIESLGVPHTEVELILVDGEPVGFDHRLGDGSRVSVYPHFATLTPDQGTALRPQPAGEIRFVADGHVAALARYLRLLGFDTLCEQTWDDDVLAAVSADDDRVLLTRDRGLLKRRIVERGVLVWDHDPDIQLLEVVRRLGLADRMRPFTRCMRCNGLLEDVEKPDVELSLESGTLRSVDRFRRCRDCRRVYWQGTHHPRLVELVRRAGGEPDRS